MSSSASAVDQQALLFARDLAKLRRLNRTYERMLPLPLDGKPPEAVVRTATALFTDLRGFSGLMERFADDPARLFDVVNAHLAVMVRVILRCGGVVEKFVGDGVLATFGAHSDLPEHSERALAAGMAAVGANEALNHRCAGEWGFRLDMGVGISAGKMVLGIIGSAERSEFGILGDAVNVAARLVGHAKPGEVLLTAAVYRGIADQVRADLASLSTVRGRQGDVEVYRIPLLGQGIPD